MGQKIAFDGYCARGYGIHQIIGLGQSSQLVRYSWSMDFLRLPRPEVASLRITDPRRIRELQMAV